MNLLKETWNITVNTLMLMMVRKFTHQIWYITKNISELQIEYIDQASADYFMNGISIAQYKAFLVNITRIVVYL